MPGTRPIDALLLVDKPAGITSHDVVSVARRALGERRIGHAGTLDPFATGLLVLLTGRATRVLPYVDGEPKEYEATIKWGAETDTDDATGAITREAPPPSRDAIEAGIASLTGRIEQVPPDYSAKQVGGRRAHAAARRGAPLELAPVVVHVHSWRVREHRDARNRRDDRVRRRHLHPRARARSRSRDGKRRASLRASAHAQRPLRCRERRRRSPICATAARRCARRARRFRRSPEQRMSARRCGASRARHARGRERRGERAALVDDRRRAARHRGAQR